MGLVLRSRFLLRCRAFGLVVTIVVTIISIILIIVMIIIIIIVFYFFFWGGGLGLSVWGWRTDWGSAWGDP